MNVINMINIMNVMSMMNMITILWNCYCQCIPIIVGSNELKMKLKIINIVIIYFTRMISLT